MSIDLCNDLKKKNKVDNQKSKKVLTDENFY